MEQIYDTLPCSTLRVSLETEGNGQSHPFTPWSKCKKRSRREHLRLRFDPFSKLRHHSTPYCCLNKSATMFCFCGIGRPDEARLAAYSAQSSATRASICASLVWFSAPRSDTSVSHSRSSFIFSNSARISRAAAGAHEPFSMRPIRRFRNPFVCK